RMSDTEGLDVADTLCFQLGGARRRMTWRQFILALGLHTEEEMAEAGFGAYWGQALEKVTGVDLFYLRSMDQGTANVPYLLVQYLFRHAERRKSGARLSEGHFIRRLAAHFGLVSNQGLRGLSVVSSELPLIDLHELGRLNICLRFGDTWAWVAKTRRQQSSSTRAGTSAAATRSSAPDYCQEIDELEGRCASYDKRHLIAPLPVAHSCPARGVSDLGQAMPAPPQLLTLMTSPTLDLSRLLSYYLLWIVLYIDVLISFYDLILGLRACDRIQSGSSLDKHRLID
ncbi:hypothetical protein Tco_1484654, partial [Tanacetum coccineum]